MRTITNYLAAALCTVLLLTVAAPSLLAGDWQRGKVPASKESLERAKLQKKLKTIIIPKISFKDADVKMIGVEAGGDGVGCGFHAATVAAGAPGVLHGMLTYVLQDEDGQTLPVHSCSAGLDYPGVGPEHSHWKDTHRVEYVAVNDDEALAAFTLLSETEGITPALETAHAVAHVVKWAPTLPKDQTIVINLSGRGDKDVVEVARLLGRQIG